MPESKAASEDCLWSITTFIDPNVAFELMEAASIMGITVRIGIKLKAVHNGKYLEFIWTPRGFTGPHSIIEFLQDPKPEFS